MHKFNSNFRSDMHRSRPVDDSKEPSTAFHSRRYDQSNGSASNRYPLDRNNDRSDSRDRSRQDRTVKDGDQSKNSQGTQNGNFRENYQDRYKETNRELIKYIYSTIDISQFKFDILRYEQQLSKFVSGKYFVAPNYYGKNCLLVVTKLKAKYYSFLIDRRQLSYSIDKVNFDEVFIHHCNIDVDLSIYSGSIFDGVYIRKGNQHEFIITDVYVFKGADYTGNKLNHKMFELEMYLNNINAQTRFIRERINAKTNLELKINKLHDIMEIRKFVDTDIKEYEKTYKVKGVCFYPEVSGMKLIHLFDSGHTDGKFDGKFDDDQQRSTRGRSVEVGDRNSSSGVSRQRTDRNSSGGADKSPTRNSDIKTDREDSDNDSSTSNNGSNMKKAKALVKKVYVAKTNGPIYAVLEMKATKTADNYKLFAVEQVKVDSTTRLKKCQMDIAYIPNMEKSKWCRDITTDSHRGSVFVKCIWRDAKRKWEPLELKEDVKLPSLMEDIRKNIVEMEESDSDSDGEN